MAIWKIDEKGPREVTRTDLKQENLLEEHLEDWIAKHPEMLGEPLLIIGRQVLVQDTKDRLDLLAVDSKGAAVIIELKRGKLRDPVDIQALRYASYVSKWSFEAFESVARGYLAESGDREFNFNALLEEFCDEAGEDPQESTLNGNQRIVIVGSDVRDKLGSVALWLRERGIDITLIEVHAYKDGSGILIEPSTVVPAPVARFTGVGRNNGGEASTRWISDGRTWHLEKRCGSETKEMVLALETILEAQFEVDAHWNQKQYVAFRANNRNWFCINTGPKSLLVSIDVRPGTFKAEDLARRLGLKAHDPDETLSEKLGSPSWLAIENRNDRKDRVRIRMKPGFEVPSAPFLAFLKEAHRACPS